jgi:DNA-binding GntR family transcriptional regulator
MDIDNDARSGSDGDTLAPILGSRNIADEVSDTIRAAIVAGQLAPDSLHSAQSLATQLNVSRTPVREGLLRLSREGLVRFERNRGIRILKPSTGDLGEIFQVREWIEAPCAALAAKNRTPEDLESLAESLASMVTAAEAGEPELAHFYDRRFHRKIIELAANTKALQYYIELGHLLSWTELTTHDTRTLDEVLDPHRDIFSAIEAGDSDRAASLTTEHIRSAFTMLSTDPAATENTGWYALLRHDRDTATDA